MEEQQTFFSVTNRETMKEAARYVLHPRIRLVCSVISGAMVLLALFSALISHFFTLAIVLLAGAAILFLEPVYLSHSVIKSTLRRLQEVNGTPESRTLCTLQEDGIRLHSEDTGGESVLPYETLSRIYELAHVACLFTRSRQMLLISKDSLGPGGMDRLCRVLLEACPRLKVRRKK